MPLLLISLLMSLSGLVAGQQDFVFIDLQNAANMGFYDPVAGDGSGGWADFGPTACMNEIPFGIQTFEDGIIPFKILDPERDRHLEHPGQQSIISHPVLPWA